VPSAATTTYHVRDYQNPDAGAADRPLTKAAKGKTKSKIEAKKGSGTSSGSSGAAAEPEPSTTGYNVRDYQNPDAGAADLPLTKAAKGKTKGKGKGEGTTFVCFNCGRTAPKLLRCSQCHHAHYCGPEVRPTKRVRVSPRLPIPWPT